MSVYVRALMVALAFTLALVGLSAPAPAGVNTEALDALVKRAGELDTDALVVMKDGAVIVEKWFDGKPRKIESMSVTKSIVALAIGRLITTGKLASVDEPVHTWFPEWKQGKKRHITIRHLLEQTSGLQADKMTGSEIYGAPDFVQLALCAELSSEPGEAFFYNNKATNLVPALVERISGKDIDVFLKAELFAPLGITDVGWVKDSKGNPHGMSGLQIRPADLAKLTQLMIDDGKAPNGKQLLDAAWVAQATSQSAKNSRYGQMWWLINDNTMIIDDELIAQWKKGGADEKFLAAIASLKGRILKEDFFAAIGEALKDVGGEDTWHKNTWMKGMPDGRLVSAETIGFRGDGWQGQQVIALKRERLVVVRMREPSEGNTEEENKKYGWSNLQHMTRALVR